MDAINGCFEFMGAILLLLNVRRLLRDKRIAGVSLLPTAFFTAWGLWNMLYYPHLGQWWSFCGGVAVVVVNATWVALAVYYNARGGGDEVSQ